MSTIDIDGEGIALLEHHMYDELHKSRKILLESQIVEDKAMRLMVFVVSSLRIASECCSALEDSGVEYLLNKFRDSVKSNREVLKKLKGTEGRT